jgi:hypothetical protein
LDAGAGEIGFAFGVSGFEFCVALATKIAQNSKLKTQNSKLKTTYGTTH